MSKQDFHLIGTKGRLDCEQKERGLKILTDHSYTEEINPDFSKIYSYKDSYIFEGYGIQSINTNLENIYYENYDDKDKRICNIKEALYSTSVIEAAFESLKNNSKWIKIDSFINQKL